MTITKKPKVSQDVSIGKGDEKVVQAFISRAGKTADETIKKPVMIRFDPELLERVDAAAKHRGISRSAWVQYTLSRALDKDDV
jgi:predicted HicB family RNase H-like nuclease